MTISTQGVISGVPCPVSAVRGDQPRQLDEFLGEGEFTVDMAGHRYLVRGCGSRREDVVRFYEKDEPAGRDVRVWQVTPSEQGGFRAEHVAAF